MKANLDRANLIKDAILKERQRIADEMYCSQKVVSCFPTAKECIAYNRALREFADRLLK